MIDYTFNFDNEYWRMLNIALCKTLTRRIHWINYFEGDKPGEVKRIRVVVPFYTSMIGDERFLLDTFVDDIVDKRVELNTDQKQRGHVILNNFSVVSDEFANPNLYLSKKVKINEYVRNIISKTKGVPVRINFDVVIQITNKLEAFRVYTKVLYLMYNYYFFNIDYFGMKIDAMVTLPDDATLEFPNEINMTSDNKKELKFSMQVFSYIPIFFEDTDEFVACDNDDANNWNLDFPMPDENSFNKLFSVRPVQWHANIADLNTMTGTTLETRSDESTMDDIETDNDIDD